MKAAIRWLFVLVVFLSGSSYTMDQEAERKCIIQPFGIAISSIDDLSEYYVKLLSLFANMPQEHERMAPAFSPYDGEICMLFSGDNPSFELFNVSANGDAMQYIEFNGTISAQELEEINTNQRSTIEKLQSGWRQPFVTRDYYWVKKQVNEYEGSLIKEVAARFEIPLKLLMVLKKQKEIHLELFPQHAERFQDVFKFSIEPHPRGIKRKQAGQ